MDISICILARGGYAKAFAMVEEMEFFKGFDRQEIVIGNQNEVGGGQYALYRDLADVHIEITDREMWDKGFGPAKQKLVDAASNDWVIVADVGEMWHENLADTSGIVGMIEQEPQCPVFRVARGPSHKVKAVLEGSMKHHVLRDDNGRIFDRRKMALAGMIHEAPHNKYTGVIWAAWARNFPPVALVEHIHDHPGRATYNQRRDVLYDHLIHEIVHNPSKRFGTDGYWWTTYWNDVVKPRWRDVSFEEWEEMPG